jgi:hypothetical protein
LGDGGKQTNPSSFGRLIELLLRCVPTYDAAEWDLHPTENTKRAEPLSTVILAECDNNSNIV